MKEFFKRCWREAKEEYRLYTIRVAAGAFNRQRARELNYHEWMCPACGRVTQGEEHPFRFMSGLKFKPCCDAFVWYGWRSFDDWIPSH